MPTLTPTPPFSFAPALNFIEGFPPTHNEQQLSNATLIKALAINGQTVVVEIKSTGTLTRPSLAYTLHAPQVPDVLALEQAVSDRLTFYLSLTDDLRPFYERARLDPPFVPILERLYGYHQIKFPSPFENAVWAILTQRTPLPIARTIKQRLIDQYGGSLTVNGVTYKSFPEALTLASASPDELPALIGNERKADYLEEAARAFANADENFLRHGPYDEVEKWLRSIKGIGAWSATFVLIRGLGRMDKVSLDMKPLMAATSKVYGRTDIATLAAHYGPHQGYWALYLRSAV
jgi:DNA-3-methyladenine glycosylase II